MKSNSTFQVKTEKETGSLWRKSICLTLGILMLSVVAFAKTPQCTPPVATISGNLNLCGASVLGTFNTTTLTAASNIIGSTFAWSTGATVATITTATPGTYTVTATALGGCTSSAKVTVRGISPTTGGSIGYDSILCGIPSTPAAIVSLAPASGQPAGYVIEYVWITTTDLNTVNGTANNMTMIAGATGETYAPGSISVTTWYRRCARVVGCTIYSAETNWVKKEPRQAATVSITGRTTFCAGNSTTLTATGGATYVWSTNATTPAITVANGGIYTITATNSAGCTITKSVTITVNPAPIPVITGALAFCAGASTTLTATGGASYVWTTGGVSESISVSTAGTFTVTATSIAGCTATKSVTTTINPLPTPTITGNLNLCDTYINLAQSTTLIATGGTSYVWSTGAITAAISTNTPGTYTVTATNANGCKATTSVTVRRISPTNPGSIGYNETVCGASFDPANIVSITPASGQPSGLAIEYVWIQTTDITTVNGTTSNFTMIAGATGESYNPSTISVTTWYRRCARTAGCGNYIAETNWVKKELLPAPTVNITGALAFCAGSFTTLTATGGATYLWSNTATTAAISTTTAGTFTVTATNAASCTATKSVTVTEAPLPTATINCRNTVCLGNCLTATAGGGVSYQWSTGATTAVVALCPTATTTYTVTVTNQYGCTATAIRTITVFPKPVAGIVGGAAICYGGSTTMTATGGATYAWSNGVLVAVNTVTPTTTTTYTVTVANSDGCTATASKTIVLNPIPVASITGNGVVCSGVSTTMTAAGGATYVWSTGATTATLTVSPSATTTYTVIATATGGCTASATFTIVLNPSPTATITGVTNICAGRSTLLTAAGGDAYLWNTGASTAAITVAPVSNRTYTVTVTKLGGCTATKSITVTPNVLTLTPMAAVTICEGQSATVGYTIANVGYLWSNSATTGQITVSPSISTLYTVTATSSLGCTATASVTVNVNPRPDASVEGSTICIGNTATIYANTTSAGATYLWNTGSTDDFLSIAPSVTTTYSVTITSVNGCTSTASGSVVVNALPTPSITGTTNICFGASTTLTATGGATYAWSKGGITAAIAVTPTATSTYTVTVTSVAGCKATKTVTVTVNPLPVAAVTGISTVCAGGTATLTASGGNTYLWSNATVSTVLSVTPLVSTYYTVTVTNGFGCTATARQLVTVNPLPVIAISGATALCAGSTTTLTASGATTYLWSNTLTTAAITLTPQASTTYTVTATSALGCKATQSVAIIVNPLPTVTASSATICAGQTATITATASAGVSYAWSNGGTTASIAISPAASTIYTVTVTNQYGCIATASVAVRVNVVPVVIFADYPTRICKGACTYVCAMGGETYTWSNGQTTATISVCPMATTTYTVTVSNSRGCTTTASRTITVNELPVVTFAGNSAVCAGGTTTITASGGASYLWSNGATTAAISITPANTQIYQVTVTSATGCTAVGTKTVTVNALPTVVASCSATVCAGTTMSLSATSAGATNFAWTGPVGFAASTQNVSRLNANTSMSGTYIVSATNAAGCVSTGSVTTAVVNCNTKVGDFVWHDQDQDGVQGGSEAGISGVTVQLYNSANTLVDTKTTDVFGEYVFEYVLSGTYYVKFSNLPAGYVFTTQSAGTANGSDAASTGITPNFTVAASVDNYTIDAGAYLGYGNIGNFVWYDANHDGVQDGEAGIAGVEVRLFDGLGTILQTTITDANGYYNFAVLPGSYAVSFYRSGWTLTTQNLNTANGSDAAVNTGKTPNFIVAAGQNRMDIDAGFIVCTCGGKTAAPNNMAAREINSAPSTGFSVSRNSVALYPNPTAASDLNVKVTTQTQDLNATIVVLDITGKMMFTQQTNLSEGTNYVRLDVTSLTEGTYLVQVRSNTAQFETQKFVRIR